MQPAGLEATPNVSHLQMRLQVTAADFTGKTEIVPLERRRPEDDRTEHSFEFRKQRFCYDPDAHAFQKLPYPVQATPPAFGLCIRHCMIQFHPFPPLPAGRSFACCLPYMSPHRGRAAAIVIRD